MCKCLNTRLYWKPHVVFQLNSCLTNGAEIWCMQYMPSIVNLAHDQALRWISCHLKRIQCGQGLLCTHGTRFRENSASYFLKTLKLQHFTVQNWNKKWLTKSVWISCQGSWEWNCGCVIHAEHSKRCALLVNTHGGGLLQGGYCMAIMADNAWWGFINVNIRCVGLKL